MSRRFVLIGIFTASSIAIGDSAEVQSSNKRPVLEEVFVTAQKREESIRDVPIAMQAFTGDTLSDLGVVDTRDLANFIPGFSYATSGTDHPIYTLRGVGFAGSSRTANSAVGVYVDEAPLPYPYMTQGAEVDLQRVEILKGPQGTLYGRNTTGGAINYIANKPSESLEFGIEAEYGRFERYSVKGYISGPLTEYVGGRLALRTISADEGWQISLTRPDDRLGEEDKQAGRATLEWTPAATLRLNATLDWWRDKSEPQAPQAIALDPQNSELGEDQLHPDVRNHPLVRSEENRLADWAPEISWTLDNDFFMPALRAYWDMTDNSTLTLIAAHTQFETGKSSLPLSGLSVINSEIEERRSEVGSQSFELRADGNIFDSRLSWLIGGFYSEDTVEDYQLFFFKTGSAVFNVQPGVTPLAERNSFRGEQDARIKAIFGNGELTLIDSLTLALGARYTDELRKYAGCSIEHPEHGGSTGLAPIFNVRSLQEGGSGGASEGDCLTLDEQTRNPSLVRKKLDEDSLGGKISFSWTPTDSYLFYASYSRGFKSGSFPIIPAAESEQYDPVTQERLDSIELGGKTSWFKEALRIDFALFDYDYQDKQLTSFFIDPIFGPLPKLFNVPKARIRGAELQIDASPLRGLFVSAATSYLDTEVREFVGTTSDGEENVDFSGNELPFTSKQSAILLMKYSFPLPFFSELEGMIGFDYSYNSESTASIEDDPIYDLVDYKLVNLRTRVGGINDRWHVTAWLRNATDEFYQLNRPLNTADTRVRYTGMPRTYGLTVAYRHF